MQLDGQYRDFPFSYPKITPLTGELKWGREFAGEFFDQK
jgi:hypothetical protein